METECSSADPQEQLGEMTCGHGRQGNISGGGTTIQCQGDGVGEAWMWPWAMKNFPKGEDRTANPQQASLHLAG